MEKNRDDFNTLTKEKLAKRVAYLCSNPSCRKITIGANEQLDKATSIGIAAHITAASSGGPRYDKALKEEQRRHISNGIWLCSSCSTLIDRDPQRYTVNVLKGWKEQAEEESIRRLEGELKTIIVDNPFLEVDLIRGTRARLPKGYSNRNPVEFRDGMHMMVIRDRPITYYELWWNFTFCIYNNSSFPVFNIQIKSIGLINFTYLDILPQINNLAPLKNLDLKAEYIDYIEGDYTVAEGIQKPLIPNVFDDLKFKLSYLDNNRIQHTTYVEFSDGKVINKKI